MSLIKTSVSQPLVVVARRNTKNGKDDSFELGHFEKKYENFEGLASNGMLFQKRLFKI